MPEGPRGVQQRRPAAAAQGLAGSEWIGSGRRERRAVTVQATFAYYGCERRSSARECRGAHPYEIEYSHDLPRVVEHTKRLVISLERSKSLRGAKVRVDAAGSPVCVCVCMRGVCTWRARVVCERGVCGVRARCVCTLACACACARMMCSHPRGGRRREPSTCTPPGRAGVVHVTCCPGRESVRAREGWGERRRRRRRRPVRSNSCGRPALCDRGPSHASRRCTAPPRSGRPPRRTSLLTNEKGSQPKRSRRRSSERDRTGDVRHKFQVREGP
jgi:hypothetical protein